MGKLTRTRRREHLFNSDFPTAAVTTSFTEIWVDVPGWMSERPAVSWSGHCIGEFMLLCTNVRVRVYMRDDGVCI